MEEEIAGEKETQKREVWVELWRTVEHSGVVWWPFDDEKVASLSRSKGEAGHCSMRSPDIILIIWTDPTLGDAAIVEFCEIQIRT